MKILERIPMINDDVCVYLNTPLHLPHDERANIIRVEGKLILKEDGGITLKLKGVFGEKGKIELKVAVKHIYIPAHKVDCVVAD